MDLKAQNTILILLPQIRNGPKQATKHGTVPRKGFQATTQIFIVFFTNSGPTLVMMVPMDPMSMTISITILFHHSCEETGRRDIISSESWTDLF